MQPSRRAGTSPHTIVAARANCPTSPKDTQSQGCQLPSETFRDRDTRFQSGKLWLQRVRLAQVEPPLQRPNSPASVQARQRYKATANRTAPQQKGTTDVPSPTSPPAESSPCK